MRAKIKLVTKTPVRVGGGKLGPFDYVLLEDTLYIIDHRRLAEALSSEGKIGRFVELMEGHPRSISMVLYELGLKRGEFLSRCARRMIKTALPTEVEPVEILETAWDSANGCPYIPGSAVKGFIRTALIFQRWKGKPSDPFGEANKKLEEEVSNISLLPRAKTLVAGLSRFLETSLREKPQDTYTDVAKFVKVTDFYPTGDVQTYLYKVNLYRRRRSEKAYPIFYVEAIPPGAEFVGEIRVEEPVELPSEEIADLLKKASSLSEDGDFWGEVVADFLYGPPISEEECYPGPILTESDFYNRKDVPRRLAFKPWEYEGLLIRIGWGAGADYKTFWHYLSDRVKGFLVKSAFSLERGYAELFPTTRKVTVSKDGRIWPFGWVEVVLLEEVQ